MELNLQQKNLTEQLNLSKFKARQAAQERELAKNELDRLIQSVKNRTNRYNSHEKPLKDLQNLNQRNKLRSERNYGQGPDSAHSRRNLDTYQKLYFNDFRGNQGGQFAHNDNDPFNINVAVPAQPQMYYRNNQPQYDQNYGRELKTNSQTIGLEMQTRQNSNFGRGKPDPLSYGMHEFSNESNYALQEIGKFKVSKLKLSMFYFQKSCILDFLCMY
jgi:hypothetical protein